MSFWKRLFRTRRTVDLANVVKSMPNNDPSVTEATLATIDVYIAAIEITRTCAALQLAVAKHEQAGAVLPVDVQTCLTQLYRQSAAAKRGVARFLHTNDCELSS